MLVEIVVCHEDMTGKRGENVTGMSILPFQVKFQYFGRKTLHYSIMMMSLHYVTNDIISLYQTINRCAPNAEVHNTARFQWVYINLVMDCVLILR